MVAIVTSNSDSRQVHFFSRKAKESCHLPCHTYKSPTMGRTLSSFGLATTNMALTKSENQAARQTLTMNGKALFDRVPSLTSNGQ
jgi:hypothetical protein